MLNIDVIPNLFRNLLGVNNETLNQVQGDKTNYC